MARANLLLGIDGGGSKTAVVLAGTDGRVLARADGAGSAIVGPPPEGPCAVLADLVQRVCAQAGVDVAAVAHCGVGLNGIDFDDEHASQLRGIAGAIGLPETKVTLVNDGIVALWGAGADQAAAIVQHGSGFTAAWRSRYGGETPFDHLNVGRIFDMRAELARVVARMIDGRLPTTPLKHAALQHYGIADEASYAERLFRGQIPHPRQMSTPPLIYRAWLGGDPAAERIVQSAATDYAAAACAMIAKTASPSPRVALGGGVIDAGPERFRQVVAERVAVRHPEATVAEPLLPPEIGAVLMAAHRLGAEIPRLCERLVECGPHRRDESQAGGPA